MILDFKDLCMSCRDSEDDKDERTKYRRVTSCRLLVRRYVRAIGSKMYNSV